MATKPIYVNRCVCCGAALPEGRQVCPKCEYNAGQALYKRLERLNEKIRAGKLIEVVYCESCIYYQNDYECPMLHDRTIHTAPNDYCSRGERKDTDD